MSSKNITLFTLLTLPLMAYTTHSYAECSRDDIDYYLNKGFTPDQITAICTAAPLDASAPVTNKSNNLDAHTSKPLSNEATSENTLNTTQHQTSLEKDEQFLKESIKGRNVVLTDDSLQYSLKICIEYGDEDLYGFAPTACPNVKFVIARKGLEVIKSQKKYIFFGTDEIKIKGIITRTIIDGLENLTTEEQKIIHKKLESGNETIIPVRDDIPLDSVEQTLLRLSI